MTPLCELSEKWHLDKHTQHSYTPVYHRLFQAYRERVATVLEIGIGYPSLMSGNGPEYKAGHSLRMWRDYFPNARIYGMDNQLECMFKEERILTFLGDQSKEADLKRVVDVIGAPLDIVIDDGSHITEHMILTANFLMPYMAKDGFYCVEDVFCPWQVAEAVKRGVVLQLGKQGDDTLVVFRMEDR